ncbi:MAG: hypothetical protein AB7P12_09385 [Alphaproteobacteria bacterium]
MGISDSWLTALLLYVVPWLLVIATTRGAKRLQRVPFLVRSIGLAVALGVIGVIVRELPQLEELLRPLGWTYFLLEYLGALIVIVPMGWWFVQRTSDAGMSRWWNLLFLAPIAAFLMPVIGTGFPLTGGERVEMGLRTLQFVGLGWWAFLSTRPTARDAHSAGERAASGT